MTRGRPRGAATLGLFVAAAVVLVACGSGDSGSAGTTAPAGSTAVSAPSNASASGGASSTSAGTAPPQTGLRDARYCEIIPTWTQGNTVTTKVYNTLSYNDCPAVRWNAITERQVNGELGSESAKWNGPRHWVMDTIQASGSSATNETITVNSVTFGIRAVITTDAGEPTVGDQFYVPNQVNRTTTFTYDDGEPVFELTDPDGNVYMMQSYAQIVDRNLSYDQLPDLGSQLELPAGWTYASRTLTEDYDLMADGLAYVVNDNLANSYQRR